MNIWLLVADSGHARVLKVSDDRHHTLEERSVLVNPSARLKEGDLVADGPGTHNDSTMGGQHRMAPKHTAKSSNREGFAREIVHSLDQALQHNEFDKLYIIAAPKFLGDLRAELSDQVRSRVAGELSRDITRAPLPELQQAFGQMA